MGFFGNGRFLALVLFAAIFLCTGVSYLGAPSFETSYSVSIQHGVCDGEGCTFLYRLALGNTGWERLDDVRLEMRAELIDSALLPLTARNFGVSYRTLRRDPQSDGRARFHTGAIEPGGRVIFTMMLRGRARDEPIEWQDILLNIVPSKGRLVESDPDVLTLGRFFGKLFT